MVIPKGLLPAELMERAFIAGGYAACPALATDMDLWVKVSDVGRTVDESRQETEAMQLGRTLILEHLEREFFPYEVQENTVTSNGDTIDGYPVSVMKVAVVNSPHLSHPIHIMVCGGSIQELLETFDISTHQIALSFGGVIKGPRWTPITERPVIIQSATGVSTQKTQERLEKIAARYGHSIRTFNQALQGVR
jgi:hypothetical protein